MSNTTIYEVSEIRLDAKRFSKLKDILAEYIEKTLGVRPRTVKLRYGLGYAFYFKGKTFTVRLMGDGRVELAIDTWGMTANEINTVRKAFNESAIAADYIVSAEEAGFLVENVEFVKEEVEVGVL